MTVLAYPMHTKGGSIELRPQNRQRKLLLKLFSVLSNNDSLRVFELASQGTIASSSTLQKMKISRSQYYNKLGELGDLGLILKDEQGVYRHTPLGEIVYQNQVITLRKIAADTNLFEQMTKFTLKNKSPNKTFETTVRAITREVVAKHDPGLWNLSELKLFETTEQYFSSITNLISNTKSEVYIAARGLDLPIIDALVAAAERSVKINMLYTDWRGFYSKSKLEPLDDLLIAATKNHPAAAKLLNDTLGIAIKRVEIQYGFAVSDNQSVAIEIVDPEDPQSFFVGIGLESGALAEKLVSYYAKLLGRPELRQHSF